MKYLAKLLCSREYSRDILRDSLVILYTNNNYYFWNILLLGFFFLFLGENILFIYYIIDIITICGLRKQNKMGYLI